MTLRVATRGFENRAALRHQAEEGVTTRLKRFEGRIRNVFILLEDVTGPQKQVVDKRCRINVRLKRGGELTIEELGKNVMASLARALDRLKAAVSRKIGRAKRGVGAG